MLFAQLHLTSKNKVKKLCLGLCFYFVSLIATSFIPFLLLFRIKKIPISKALDLTLYLKRETQIMPVLQGMNELVPIYKLMEKRDMDDTEKQLKVTF